MSQQAALGRLRAGEHKLVKADESLVKFADRVRAGGGGCGRAGRGRGGLAGAGRRVARGRRSEGRGRLGGCRRLLGGRRRRQLLGARCLRLGLGLLVRGRRLGRLGRPRLPGRCGWGPRLLSRGRLVVATVALVEEMPGGGEDALVGRGERLEETLG